MKRNKYGVEQVYVCAYIPADVHASLVRFAQEDNFNTMSDMVRKILREYAERRNAEFTGTGSEE